MTWRSRCGVVTAVVLAATLVMQTPAANASPWSPHVHVSGHIDCGGLDEAVSIEYWASNGERGWATFTADGLSAPWRKILKPGGNGWLWATLQIKTYHVHLWRVPRENGVSLTLRVTCKTWLLGGVSSFKTSFGVARPMRGDGATRHVCRSTVFGCVV